MRNHTRKRWQPLIALLGLVIISIVLFSCKPVQNEGQINWVTASLAINQSGPSENINGPTRVIIGTDFTSALVIAVAEDVDVDSVTWASYITEYLARGILAADSTVELSLPLDTNMRIIQVAFSSDLSLSEITDGTITADLIGVSDVITISGTSQTVTVAISLSSQTTATPTYAVGGTIAGLVGTDLVLQNSGGDDITTSANGAFTFDTSLEEGTAYDVTVATQPSTGSCIINNSNGTMSTVDVTDVSVICLMGGAVQGTSLAMNSADAAVTTLAGNGGSAIVDGPGLTTAEFSQLQKVTTDGTHLFLADQHRIRKIVIATGVVSTLAGNASSGSFNSIGTDATFNFPSGITTDGTNLYVADTSNNLIRKIDISSTEVTTLAGTGTPGTNDGTGTVDATFTGPSGLTTDGTKLFITDNGRLIRQLDLSTLAVTTLAGNGSTTFTDGIGTMATFNNPGGITTDGTNLFVADASNNRIRKMDVSSGDWEVTTLAGTTVAGSSDGTGTSAYFNTPYGITTDGTNLFVADTYSNKIRKISDISSATAGVVTTLAGSGGSSSANGIGLDADFGSPNGIITDGTDLFVADPMNWLFRKIEKSP